MLKNAPIVAVKSQIKAITYVLRKKEKSHILLNKYYFKIFYKIGKTKNPTFGKVVENGSAYNDRLLFWVPSYICLSMTRRYHL